MQYWYAEQFRRYRLQCVRAFSNFYIKTGNGGPNNTKELIRVPARYGDQSRVAATIVRANSENKILSVPFITCFISSVEMAPERRQDPQFIRSVQVNERRYDAEAGRYTNEIGNRYTVEEYMPIPYNLTLQVDIWTNNTDTKEQLLEQIMTLYNPAIDIQTSVNPLDWTVLTYLEMTGITWSSRTIPIGTDNPIEVATFQYKIPAWINPPAKVKKQAIITEIITSIIQGEKDPDAIGWDSYELLSRTITTPQNANILVTPIGGYDYELQLCDITGSTVDNARLPTIINSKTNPTLFSGMKFLWNNTTISIADIEINAAVADIRTSLISTNNNCILFNGNEIQFINNESGDNVFQNIVPGSLEALGILETTYPGTNLAWWRLLQLYGSVNTHSLYGLNASQIRITTVEDITQTNSDITGWIDFHPTDQNKLIWHADSSTFPDTTLADINAIINPQQSGPGINLPDVAIGQRYLLTNDPSVTSQSWGDMTALENDIVEWNGTHWIVSWSAKNNTGVTQYVMNNRSNRVYKWENDYWSVVIAPRYHQGYWKLVL